MKLQTGKFILVILESLFLSVGTYLFSMGRQFWDRLYLRKILGC
jgi:hypothetical protein